MSFPDRRAFLRRLARLSTMPLFCGGGVFGYGSLVERHRIAVERHKVTLALGDRAPERFRALAMGDFHFDPLYESDYLARCVATANQLQPDFVFLTGDYVTSRSDRMGELSALLAKLKPRAGIFACLGNHDHWSNATRVTTGLKMAGIEVLFNQHTRVSVSGGELVVAGMQSAWGGRPNWDHASRGMRKGERAVALMHEPDFAMELKKDGRVALQLSGHTHGGQVRVPGIGALRLPLWGRMFQAGFYDVDQLKLHVNRGIGTITWHVRLLCPPEITCLDITNAGASAA